MIICQCCSKGESVLSSQQLNAPIAQLVEQLPFKEWVVGSTPTGRTLLIAIYNGRSNAHQPAPVTMREIAITSKRI